ncbi:peptidase inhibitor family I36 protein [Streptosporangium sp. NPDC051022]|uniref:peptidase inhibitor family I36 protein n=1 Tax=Streptosporangium sp. NPDC051022 TaxID=3155752 RepID=UPI003420F806
MRARVRFLAVVAACLTFLTCTFGSTGALAAAAAWIPCPSGDVCFYTGENGTGSMCHWTNSDPDWTTGSDVCSWATTTLTRSVWNNGQATAYPTLYFYWGTNYTRYAGCIDRGWGANIGPTYLFSHKWVTGSCPP